MIKTMIFFKRRTIKEFMIGINKPPRENSLNSGIMDRPVIQSIRPEIISILRI